MNRAILIELSTYTPSCCTYLNQQEGKVVIEQVGLSVVQYYEWRQDMNSYSPVDLVTQACKEENDWIVYSILHRVGLGWPNHHFVSFVGKRAAEYNRKQLLRYCLYQDSIKLYWIAYGAARGGNKEILNDMIERGANDHNDIWGDVAKEAARGGHMDIVNDMIRRGTRNWDLIACGAARGGHMDIVNDMIRRGTRAYDPIAGRAEEFGHMDIIQQMIKRGANPSSIHITPPIREQFIYTWDNKEYSFWCSASED